MTDPNALKLLFPTLRQEGGDHYQKHRDTALYFYNRE
jgi:hypothetical protein